MEEKQVEVQMIEKLVVVVLVVVEKTGEKEQSATWIKEASEMD